MGSGGPKGELLAAGAGVADIAGGITAHKPDMIKWGAIAVAGTAIRALTPPPPKTYPGLRDISVIDPLAYLPTVYGRRRVTAQLAEITSTAAGPTDNHFWLWLVLALCHGEVLSIDELYFDGRLVLAADGTWLPPFDSQTGFVRYAKYVGTSDQTTGTVGKQIGNRQRLRLVGGAAADTYELNYGGQVTAPIRKDAVAATIQAAIAALPNVGAGNVAVVVNTGPPNAGDILVSFTNVLYDTNGPLLIVQGGTGGLTGTAVSLTGGTVDTLAITGDSLAAVDPNWAPDADGVNRHCLAGVAYLLLQMHYQADLFPSGIPQVDAVVRGRLLKDPRTGLTGYGTNAILAWREYATNPIYGASIPEADVLDGDASSGAWAEADYCDELAPQPSDTGAWGIYRCGAFDAGPGDAVVLQPQPAKGTVSCVAGVATFSVSQAGVLANGAMVIVPPTGVRTWYDVANFDGSTGCTLLPHGGGAAPTFGAAAFAFAPPIGPGSLIWIRNAVGQSHTINEQWTVLVVAVPPGPLDGLELQLDDGSGHPYQIGNGFGAGYGTNNVGVVQLVAQAVRFTAQGVLDCGQPHRTNLRNLLAAARADMFSLGGLVQPYIRRVRSPETFELAQPNLDASSFVHTFPGGLDAPNRLRTSYTDPARNWQRTSFCWPPIDATNPYLVADNNVLNERSIDLVMVSDRHQAERIAMVLLEEARAGVTFTANAVEAALQLAVDDVVNVTHRTPGWGATEANTKPITSSAAGNPGVVYAPAHGLPAGARVRIRGHSGSTPSLNGDYYATILDGDHFSIPVDVTVGGAGGWVAPAPQPCWVTGIGIRPAAEGNPVSLSGLRYVPTAYDDQLTPDDLLPPLTNLPDPWTVPPPVDLVLATAPGDPRVSVSWGAAPDARVDHYRIEGQRTACGQAGVAPDADFRSYTPDSLTACHGWIPTQDEDTWSVRVIAVSQLGVESTPLEIDGYVAHVSRLPILGSGETTQAVTAAVGVGQVTYTIPFGDRCDYVLVYTSENVDGGTHLPSLIPQQAVEVARPASGVATLPIVTTMQSPTDWYRTVIVVPCNNDGTQGQAQTVGPTQCTHTATGPAHPPSGVTAGTPTSTTLPFTWTDTDSGVAGEYARVWVDGAIVNATVALGVQAYAPGGFAPGSAHAVGVDHILNGVPNPATGPVTIVMTTAALATPSVTSASQAETDTNYPDGTGWWTERVSWTVSNAPDGTYVIDVYAASVGGARGGLLASGITPSTGYWDHQVPSIWDDGAHTPTTYERYDVVLRRVADGVTMPNDALTAGVSYHLALAPSR